MYNFSHPKEEEEGKKGEENEGEKKIKFRIMTVINEGN